MITFIIIWTLSGILASSLFLYVCKNHWKKITIKDLILSVLMLITGIPSLIIILSYISNHTTIFDKTIWEWNE